MQDVNADSFACRQVLDGVGTHTVVLSMRMRVITDAVVMNMKSIEGGYYTVKLSETPKQEDKDLGQDFLNTTNVT